MADLSETSLPIQQRPVTVGTQEFMLAETADFPRDDPWSVLTRDVVSGLKEDGAFDGRNFLEAGIGDGRNALIAAGVGDGGARAIIGVELDDWRLDLARQNFEKVGIEAARVALHRNDIVEWLEDGVLPLSGWSLACLPQAPGFAAENDADGYDENSGSLERFHELQLGHAEHTVDTYGLTLNAAYLAALRSRVHTGNFNALLTMSDRVPQPVLEELFAKTGWNIAEVFPADEPVQQDPDTSIIWTTGFDDGRRFYEKDAGGEFVPISATVAEARRRSSVVVDGEHAREALNVYHGLSVYRLQPETEAQHGDN